MPRTPLAAVALLLSLAASTDADARAAYVKLPEAVRTSEIVAVVDVVEIQDARIVGGPPGYAQRVVAHPIDVLKGELPPTFAIAADSDFICAPVPYEQPGKYLVFLAHQGEALATVNHSHGRMQIEDDQLDWPYDDSAARVSTDPVLRKLRALIGRQGPRPKGPPVVELIPVDPPRLDEPSTEVAPVIATAVVETSTVEAAPVAPPAPEASADAEPQDMPWLVPLSMATGALATMLGFAFAWRRATGGRR